jgi:hypothetical protein
MYHTTVNHQISNINQTIKQLFVIIMKHLFRIIRYLPFAAAFAACLTACDLSDTRDELASISTAYFKINLLYAETSYRFTYNGAPAGGINTISRKDTVGVLQAFREDSAEPELSDTLHILPGSTLTYIQLPGEPLKRYGGASSETEPEPADSACVKMRFTHYESTSANDSLRLIWISSKKSNLSLPGAVAEPFDTLTVYLGKLSRYVEFNTAKYRETGNTAYFFCTLQQWDDGSGAWKNSAVVKKAAFSKLKPEYKFSTYSIDFRNAIIDFRFLFGEKWPI